MQGIVDPGEGSEAESEVEAADEALDAVLDEGGGEHGPLARAKPAHAARDVGGHGHARHGLDGEVAGHEGVVAEAGDARAPEQVADDVVLAHVRGEVVDALGQRRGAGGGQEGVAGGVGGEVEVGAAEHVALADDAGRDADGVDGAVELGVRRGQERLLEAAAAVRPAAREHRRRHVDRAAAGAGAVRDGGVGEQRLALGAAVAHGRHRVDDEGELVHELEGRGGALAVGPEAAERVDHAAGDVPRDPDVAVQRPEDVPFRLAERPAHVPDLGVRADVVVVVVVAREEGVLGLDEDPGVEVGEVGHQLAEHGIGGVLLGLDAEVDGQLVARVRLVEDGGEALVEGGLEALGWADDGDMGDVVFGEGWRDGFIGYRRVVSEAGTNLVVRWCLIPVAVT